ncbi:MAG: hypothetical protein KTR25_07370 [Myxococcales bacterium]|nr:hypothetical protein [Myxococcales bacterium]
MPDQLHSVPTRWKVGLVACLFLGIFGCRAEQLNNSRGYPPERGDLWPQRRAVLFFTTGMDGYIEPCGCTSRPLGGVARLASILSEEKEPSMLMDAGQLLLPTESLDDMTRPQHLAKAQYLARAFRKLGVVAINLGPPDLKQGTSFLMGLQKEGSVPFVSANIRPRKEGGLSVARSRLDMVGGIRFGVTGVAIPEAAAATSDDIVALEIAPAVRAEVQTLRKDGAEVVVVLAHLPVADAQMLAKAIPEMDILIRSPGTPIEGVPQPPVQIGPVVIVEAGQRGQYIGRVRVVVPKNRSERPFVLDDGGAKMEADKARLERRIAALQKEIDLFGVDTSAQAAREARLQVKRQLEQRLASLSLPSAGPAGDAARLELSLIPIETSVNEDDSMKRLLSAYYQELRTMNLSRGDPEACRLDSEDAPIFVGTDKCALCHQEEYAFWQNTSHARAWATLEREARHYDFTCVGCHSVGFRKPGGYCILDQSKPYQNVGCENCHGPGSKHAAAPVPGSISRADTVGVCAESCHVPEHSDMFIYESYIKKITGEGHMRGGSE